MARLLGIPMRLKNVPMVFWLLIILISPVFVGWAIATWHISHPKMDTWGLITWHYEVQELGWSWALFFKPHNEHMIALPRQVYSWALQLLGEESWLVCYLSLLASVACFLSIARLARWQMPGKPAALMPMLALTSFLVISPAQGEAWIWEMLFGNYVPGMMLCLGLVVRRLAWPLGVRFGLLAIFCFAAVLSAGCGFLVAFLLVVDALLDGPPEKAAPGSWRAMVALLTLVGLGLIALQWVLTAARAGDHADLSSILDNPGLALHFYTLLCGLSFAWGTDAEPQWQGCLAGGLMIVIFLSATVYMLWRRDRTLRRSAAPWISLGLFTMAVSGLILLSRMGKTWSAALAERYVNFSMLLAVACLFLVPLVLADVARRAPHLKNSLRHGQVFAMGILAALAVPQFFSGFESMRWDSVRRMQEGAALHWSLIFPEETTSFLGDKRRTYGLQAAKMVRDGMLPKDFLATDASLTSWRRGDQPLRAERGHFSTLVVQADGSLLAQGRALVPRAKSLPDAILLTSSPDGVQPGTILGVGRPRLPSSIFHREKWRKEDQDMYESWSMELPPDRWTSRPEFLQAWAVDLENRRVMRLSQIWSLKDGKPSLSLTGN